MLKMYSLVVQFIGACLEPVMVVVTELLVGGSLRKYLVGLRPRSLEPRVAVGFALDIARAMECLHAHAIIHRDLKPGKIAIWKPGCFMGIYMVDFCNPE
jgi:serine/threonine protein kinase